MGDLTTFQGLLFFFFNFHQNTGGRAGEAGCPGASLAPRRRRKRPPRYTGCAIVPRTPHADMYPTPYPPFSIVYSCLLPLRNSSICKKVSKLFSD